MTANTFWTIWLLVHLVLAVGLLGALTHQADPSRCLSAKRPAGSSRASAR